MSPALVAAMSGKQVFLVLLFAIGLVAFAASKVEKRRKSTKTKVGKRLKGELAEAEAHSGESATAIFHQRETFSKAREKEGGDLVHRAEVVLGSMLRQAGLFESAPQYVQRAAMTAAIPAFLIGFVKDNLFLAFVLTIGLMGIMLLRLRGKAKKRADNFDKQLAMAVPLLLGSLRAGMNTPEALEETAKSTQKPLSEELSWALGKIKAGFQPTAALDEMAVGINSQGAELFVQAVSLNWDSGGRLANVVEKLKELLEGRLAFEQKVHAASAEQRISINVIMVVPWFLGGLMFWRMPDDFRLLWKTNTGIFLLYLAVVLQVAGFFWARSIVKMKIN